jgi:hypothetical protein
VRASPSWYNQSKSPFPRINNSTKKASRDYENSDDFEQEVKATAANKALMAFLAKHRSNEKRVPLADVKRQLELD